MIYERRRVNRSARAVNEMLQYVVLACSSRKAAGYSLLIPFTNFQPSPIQKAFPLSVIIWKPKHSHTDNVSLPPVISTQSESVCALISYFHMIDDKSTFLCFVPPVWDAATE